MNILNKQISGMAPTFGNADASIAKHQKFSWAKPCEPGTFLLIPKINLNIDGSYQREQVSKAKVREIAREWDWKLFGVLLVILRPDGSFWVYDGGHRCRASFLREDIAELPCMVFEVTDSKDEARAFVGANTMKTGVSAYSKHVASVATGEPNAVATESIITKYGYFSTDSSSRKFGFAAINSLAKWVKQDSSRAEKTFAACTEIALEGEAISGRVIDALYTCSRKLEGHADIFKNGHLDKLKQETLPGIEAAIRRETAIIGQGGATVGAKAILDILNRHKKRRMRFPNLNP